MYKHHDGWNELLFSEELECKENLNIFCSKMKEIAKGCISSLSIGKFYPKLYWTEELKETRRICESLYNKYRQNKSVQNTINWKRP